MLYKSLVQICHRSGYWTFISFSSPAHNANPFRTASATCGHNSEHCENQWEKHWYLLSISLAVLFWRIRGEKLCMNWTFCVLAVMHYISNKKDFCFEFEFTSWHTFKSNEIFTTHYSESKEQGLDSAHTTWVSSIDKNFSIVYVSNMSVAILYNLQKHSSALDFLLANN